LKNYWKRQTERNFTVQQSEQTIKNGPQRQRIVRHTTNKPLYVLTKHHSKSQHNTVADVGFFSGE